MMRLSVVLMVLFSLVLAVPGFTAPNGGGSDATRKYLNEELPNKSSKVFTACENEWMLGRRGVDWNGTQQWIKSLGSGWRTPTIAELKALYIKMGKRPHYFRFSSVLAVAVRSR